MSQLSAPQDENFLSGLLDADRTAVIGYSMGGYGALIAAGAGVSPEAVVNDWVPGSKLEMIHAGNSDYTSLLDDRIKAKEYLLYLDLIPVSNNADTWRP